MYCGRAWKEALRAWLFFLVVGNILALRSQVSQVAQWWKICLVSCSFFKQMWSWFLGQEDPLEKEMSTHSSILAWEIPWTEEPGGLQSMGSQKSQIQWLKNNNLSINRTNLCESPSEDPQQSVMSAQELLLLTPFSHVWLFATPWTVGHQAPLSMGFSRQGYWSGVPSPPPGDLPDPGIEPASPDGSRTEGFCIAEPQGKPLTGRTDLFSDWAWISDARWSLQSLPFCPPVRDVIAWPLENLPPGLSELTEHQSGDQTDKRDFCSLRLLHCLGRRLACKPTASPSG